jgi:hypothetical protein
MGTLCRAYLYVLSAYHLFTGMVSMFFPGFAMTFYKWFYKCEPPDREDLYLILKPWGALAAFAGIAGLYAAGDPVRYRGVILGLILLLSFRIYYRMVFSGKLERHANIPRRRNLLNTCLIALGVIILGTWYFQVAS